MEVISNNTTHKRKNYDDMILTGIISHITERCMQKKLGYYTYYVH